MTDQYGRTIDYLRISVTDRCNLRCVFCMPEEGIENVPHSEILTYEEIVRLTKAAAALGISKIKITGGEPLVRKNLAALIRQIKQIEGIHTVTLTTNGILFHELGPELAAAGLTGVNFSLCSTDPGEFLKITRVNAYEEVLAAIESSLQLGLKTKINCVPFKQYNDSGVIDLALLAKKYPLDVRFIELMPIGLGSRFEPVDPSGLLQELTAKFGQPQRSSSMQGNGPACYYDFPGFQGSIGFISALSQKFCASCNRIRLTSTGMLKPCLCSRDRKSVV
jgi:cyclic pyranopterin phosphate synthase